MEYFENAMYSKVSKKREKKEKYYTYSVKYQIKDHLINKYVSIFDLGPYQNKSVDYPDYAKRLANRLKKEKSDIGILVCGSGTGMAISANKIKGIRAAVCYNATSTRLSRQHNNANIMEKL